MNYQVAFEIHYHYNRFFGNQKFFFNNLIPDFCIYQIQNFSCTNIIQYVHKIKIQVNVFSIPVAYKALS